ncbi:MAG: hypothetical protein J6386_06365 [Candidatus Synoicihabitans palmerolidicus]|nr:hypothetical protein [Candidatus Synoicihabitans palmerolidicus]
MLCDIYIRPSLPELGSLVPPDYQFQWLDAPQWVNAFQTAGLRVLRHESLSRRYVYPSAQALLRRLHDTGVALPQRTLSFGAIKNVLRDYSRQFQDSAGVIATWSTLRIEVSL